MMARDLNPPPSTQWCYARAFVHLGGYARAVRTLAPSFPTVPLTKTIVALHHLHPLAKVDLPHFVNNFHPEIDLVLDKEAFIYVLTHFLCFSSGGFLGMVYELLWNYFVPNDFASNFDLLKKICRHIVHGHVLPSISHMFVTSQLLVLEKQIGGVQPIAIGEVIYWIVAFTLVIQFKDTFVEHFSPH